MWGIGRDNHFFPGDWQAYPEGAGFLKLCEVSKRRLGKSEEEGGVCIPGIAHGMKKHQIWSATNRWRRCQVLWGGVAGMGGQTQGKALAGCCDHLAEPTTKDSHLRTLGILPPPILTKGRKFPTMMSPRWKWASCSKRGLQLHWGTLVTSKAAAAAWCVRLQRWYAKVWVWCGWEVRN